MGINKDWFLEKINYFLENDERNRMKRVDNSYFFLKASYLQTSSYTVKSSTLASKYISNHTFLQIFRYPQYR